MNHYADGCPNCEHLKRQLDKAEQALDNAIRDRQSAELKLRIAPDPSELVEMQATISTLKLALREICMEKEAYPDHGRLLDPIFNRLAMVGEGVEI